MIALDVDKCFMVESMLLCTTPRIQCTMCSEIKFGPPTGRVCHASTTTNDTNF